jgi:hypothetical protein
VRRIHEMSTRSSAAGILICGFTTLLLAQAPPAPPKPGPEYKKLEYFLGTWKEEGEIKANGYVTAGKGVTTATYALGPGGFSLERRAAGQIPNTFGIIAYDSYAQAYTTFYASSAALVGTGIGSLNGNTWTWMVEDRLAGKVVKGRTTITMLSPTEYTSKYEMADGKGGYTTLVESKATKETR